jgi:hypothetical protein
VVDVSDDGDVAKIQGTAFQVLEERPVLTDSEPGFGRFVSSK